MSCIFADHIRYIISSGSLSLLKVRIQKWYYVEHSVILSQKRAGATDPKDFAIFWTKLLNHSSKFGSERFCCLRE